MNDHSTRRDFIKTASLGPLGASAEIALGGASDFSHAPI